jgi:hypothetical protein
MTHCESCDSPPYFQYPLVPTYHPIYKVMLINQVLVDSILRTNYLILTALHLDSCLPIEHTCLSNYRSKIIESRAVPQPLKPNSGG